MELPAGAQQPGKTYRVGILSGRTPATERPNLDAFRRALSGLGYEEGKNLEIAYRFAGGDLKRDSELAAELVQAKPDVIVADGYSMIVAAKRATTSVPIVMAENGVDPVGSGLIASFAGPGGNITGMTSMRTDLNGKRLQLLKELVPRLRRVAVVRNPSDSGNLVAWRVMESAAHTIGIAPVAIDIRSPDQIDAALKALPAVHAGALDVMSNLVMSSNAGRIVRLVTAQRLPAVYSVDAYIAAGGLIVFGASEAASWSRAATYVDRILKGANPADLPVERPTTFELTVNLKAARDIGITVPPVHLAPRYGDYQVDAHSRRR